LEEELTKSNVVVLPPSYAYDHDSKKSSEDVEYLWEDVKLLFQNAALCRSYAAHEANWINEVVVPMIQLILRHDNLSRVVDMKNV
jgi:hypothetical protein